MVLLPAAGIPSASAVTNVLFSPDPGAYRVLKEQLSLTTGAWTNSLQRLDQSHRRACHLADEVLSLVQTVNTRTRPSTRNQALL
jgi:hypothetical protein